MREVQIIMTTITPKFQKSKLKTAYHRHAKRTRIKQQKVLTLIWLQYLLSVQKLAAEAQNKAKEQKKSVVHGEHIRAVSKNVIKACKA